MLPYNPKEQFPEKYREACFYAWYRAGCPSLQTSKGTTKIGSNQIVKVMPIDEESGRRPDIQTVIKWMKKYGWNERADALDAIASTQLDEQVIIERRDQLRRMSEAGKKMLEKGLKFLEQDDPFKDNASAAVRAVIAGTEMMFKYGGAADRLTAIANMNDKQLQAEALRLLGKESDDDENIDATLEDIPTESSEPDAEADDSNE